MQIAARVSGRMPWEAAMTGIPAHLVGAGRAWLGYSSAVILLVLMLYGSSASAAVAVAGGVLIPVATPGPSYVADNNHPLPYMAYVPTSYTATGAAVPLVFCLPGDGEAGNGTSNGTLTPGTTNQLASVLGNGPLSLINAGSTYFANPAAIVVQPQSPLKAGSAFVTARVDLTLRLILATYHIDPLRISCVGMGSGAGALMRWAYLDANSPNYAMAAVVAVANTQGLGTTYTDFTQLATTTTWMINDSDDPTAAPLFQTGRIWNGYGDGWLGGIARSIDQATYGGALPPTSVKARCLTTHPDVIAISASNFNATTVIPATCLSGTYTGYYNANNPAGWTWVPGQVFTAGSKVQITLRQGGGFAGWTATFGTGATPNTLFWNWVLAQRAGQVPSGFPTSIANVSVNAAQTQMTLGQQQTLTATAVDSSGKPVSPQPFISWTCSAGQTIASTGIGTGVLSANTAANPAIITASLPGTPFSATTAVTVADAVLGTCMLWPQGGGVSGCGMLGRYAAPGPGTVTIERDTVLGQDIGLAPITLITVSDPTGHTVAASDVTYQATTVGTVTIPVPAGPAGIWRFTVQGGRQGDRIVFTLPPTDSAGIRGEMALGQVGGAARHGWLWVPAGTGRVLIEAINGGSVTLSTATGTLLPGTSVGTGLWQYTNLPGGTAIQIAINAGTNAIAIDGMPGLVCPDAATATDLQGGTSIVGGGLVEGPLQARARQQMLTDIAENLNPVLSFPTLTAGVLPVTPANPIAVLQLFGNYGPISGLQAADAAQVIDPTSMFFGSLGGTPDGTIHGPEVSPYDAIGLAAAVAADGTLNPTHGNPALTSRAVLLAFHFLSRLQGDDLLRAGDLAANGGYPMASPFFTYLGSIAGPYPLLHPYLDATTDAIWRDGLIAVGDRLAGFTGYETNQWWHVVLGHLEIYRATGEPRFKTWFEREAGQILTRPADSTSLLGQHPAGYFLENGGPDGNYDAISDTYLSQAWHEYSALPDADPTITQMLSDAIARNLNFTSCHWLPQPDGLLIGPTSMSTRKVTSFASQGWPGTKFARDGFPLAAALWLSTPEPAAGIGIAGALPHFVNDNAWAMSALDLLVPAGIALQSSATRGIPAEWTNEAIVCANLPVATPAVFPCQSAAGTWDLPGQIAWKQGNLYGLSFYGVPGSSALITPANCRIGGAPSALWSPTTGTILLSQHNTHFEDGAAVGDNGVATPDDLTNTCVYGGYQGGYWTTGREPGALTWVTTGKEFQITGTANDAVKAPVTWDYNYIGGQLDLTVIVTTSAVTAPTMNLPFPIEAAGAALALSGGGARFTTANGGVATITWDGGVAATVSNLLATGITATPTPSVRCLRIPLTGSGGTWTRHVRFTTSATATNALAPAAVVVVTPANDTPIPTTTTTIQSTAPATSTASNSTQTTAGTTSTPSVSTSQTNGSSSTTTTAATTTNSTTTSSSSGSASTTQIAAVTSPANSAAPADTSSTTAAAPTVQSKDADSAAAPQATGGASGGGCGLGAGVAMMLTVLSLRRRRN
jgi:hypothetical protein